MKELASIAYNCLVNLTEGKPTPAAEVALMTTEPTYRLVGNNVEKRRDSYTVRFVASPAQLRDMAHQLEQAADDVESLAAVTIREGLDEEPAPVVDPSFGMVFLTDGVLYWKVTKAGSVESWCPSSQTWVPSEYRCTSDFPKELLHRLVIVDPDALAPNMTRP